LLEMVRARGLATKVLIVTAYDYFEIMQSAIQLKADGFLLKPVRTEALLKAVGDCLAGIGTQPQSSVHPARSPVSAATPLVAEDGHGMRARIVEMVGARAYRDCLSLVRRRLETIYGHKDAAPRYAVLDLAEMLSGLVTQSGRKLPEPLARGVEELENQRLDTRSHHKVQELFCEIADFLFAGDAEPGATAAQRIQTVLNMIERNLHKGVTLEDAADFANISPCYLSRLFRKEMNMTFISYLKGQRIERAKELLQSSNLPITNVSLDLSYADANYFCKTFKKEVGLSPSEYRRQFQKPSGHSIETHQNMDTAA
jgi:two-component system response regulator YesN